jgi:hypothetical protein
LLHPPSSAVPRNTWEREATFAVEAERERGRVRSVHVAGLGAVVAGAGGVAAGGVVAGGGSSVASAGVPANDRHATIAAIGIERLVMPSWNPLNRESSSAIAAQPKGAAN